MRCTLETMSVEVILCGLLSGRKSALLGSDYSLSLTFTHPLEHYSLMAAMYFYVRNQHLFRMAGLEFWHHAYNTCMYGNAAAVAVMVMHLS